MSKESLAFGERLAGLIPEWPPPLASVEELLPEALTWRPLGELLPREEYGPPLAGTVHEQWVTCGKPGCKCARGELHGPYWYRFERVEGRLCKRYVPRAELEAVRTRCAERQRLAFALRESRRRMALKLAATREYMRPWRAVVDEMTKQAAAKRRKDKRNGTTG